MKSVSALFALLAITSSVLAQDPHAGETPQARETRMKWWREARFGMFIHWGLYAQPAGVWDGKRSPGLGEWLMHDFKIPVDDYAQLQSKFNPVDFDADRWVAIAKAAGMKYIVMTAKHHEGFAMFHSKDPFGIANTPFKRDPIGEMAEACKKAGLKFGVYYSQAQDWHHAGGGAYGGHWDPKQDGAFSTYVKNVAAPQVKELMKYKPAVLWWDTPVEMTKADVDALTAPLPKTIIMNNRLGGGVKGDTETPEQTIPATGFPGRDWETCMTINDTWGFKRYDTNFKSTQNLLRNLIDIASKGGNYLLNVGPTDRGIIPAPEVDRLYEIGKWLQRNGRSVYATSASPYRRLPFEGRATVKGNSLFLNVFTWPAAGLSLPGLKNKVLEVRKVATGEKVNFTQADDGTVAVQSVNVEPISTALELKLDGKPMVDLPEPVLSFGAKGMALPLESATLAGGLELEHEPENVGYWTDASDSVTWKVTATEDFRGEVHVDYACAAGAGGSVVSVQVDGKEVATIGPLPETGSWDTYKTRFSTGGILIPAGSHSLRLVAKTMPHGAVMNLRGVQLKDGHY